jgi:hypothetical protein
MTIGKGVFAGLILAAVFTIVDAVVLSIIILRMISQVDRWTELQSKKFQNTEPVVMFLVVSTLISLFLQDTKLTIEEELLQLVSRELSTSDKQELIWIGAPANTSFRLRFFPPNCLFVIEVQLGETDYTDAIDIIGSFSSSFDGE